MKLVISFLFFLSASTHVFACRLKTPTVNLSGAMSLTMRTLGLMNDPNLKAVSRYFVNEEEAKSFEVDLLMGGIFLSPKTIEKYKDHFFIIDKSQELEKQMASKKVGGQVVRTRGLTPIEVIHRTLNLVREISIGCESNIQAVKTDLNYRIKKLKKIDWSHQQIVFFLGNLKNKLPLKVMVNDGFVKYLVDNFQLRTYPTTAAYSGWSQKKLNELKKSNAYMIGMIPLDKSRSSRISFTEIKKNQWNAEGRFILIPGFGQLAFLEELAKIVKKKWKVN